MVRIKWVMFLLHFNLKLREEDVKRMDTGQLHMLVKKLFMNVQQVVLIMALRREYVSLEVQVEYG